MLALKGLGSRREADQYIAAGLVKVNDVVVTTLGVQVSEDAVIQLLPDHDQLYHSSTTCILHKPLGIVSCQPERHQTPAIQLLTAANYYHYQYSDTSSKRRPTKSTSFTGMEPYRLSKMAVAGRLDINTTGLLLLTQCGVTARTIIGPDSTVEKEYLVRVGTNRHNRSKSSSSLLHHLDESKDEVQEILYRLRQGIRDGGDVLQAERVTIQNQNQFNVVLTAGKHHHIRRMMSAVNIPVQAIKRVRIGTISLGTLPLGKWQYIPKDQLTE